MTQERAAASRSTGRGVAALVLGAVAIGFAPIFVRYSEAGSSATAFWRVALALPAMLLWASGPKRDASPTAGKRPPLLLLVFAGVCFGLDLVVWHWAIHLTTVSNATLEANLGVIFVPLFAWLFFGQRIGRPFLVALAISIVGTLLLVGRNAHLSAQTLRGDALGILTAVFYSGYLLSVKAARDRGTRTSVIMAVSGVVTALVIYPVARLSGETILPSTFQGWGILFALAFISQLGGQSLITYALASLPAAFAALGLLLQPATATVAAWVLLGESLAPAQLAGGAILLFGLWLAKRSS